MNKNICKLILDREITKENKNLSKFHRHNNSQKFGTKFCEKHQVLVYYVNTYKGCLKCLREK